MNACIIIPTLNEADNIGILITKIKKLYSDVNIIVADGWSTDGTIDIVEKMRKKFGRISLVSCDKGIGFGSAVVTSFKFALKNGFDPIITMDGDLAHDPIYLERFFENIKHMDLVIGSRYISGVRVDGWRFKKLLISKLANMYVAYLMVKPIWDFTSGYRAYSAKFLKKINMDNIPDYAYLFQIHMVYLAYSLKLKVKEIPFLYLGMEYGESKLTSTDRRKTFTKCFKYRAPFLEMLRHLTYVKKDYRRFVHEYEELLNPPPYKKTHVKSESDKLMVDIGVMAYNEEKNVKKCLSALQKQKFDAGIISNIYVVSSGSTDKTNEIVRKMGEKDSTIKLIVQNSREGKASAINEFLKISKADVCVVESADTITKNSTIENLVKPFFNSKIGMTGAHPIPVNSKRSFIGFCVNKLWSLHHLMALDQPKCGELIAFRNILTKIPKHTAVDEAVIEALIREAGFGIEYAPEAIVQNKGPDTLKDFFKQRKRIATGHKHLLSTKGYGVSTLKSSKILPYLIKDFHLNIREIIFTFGMIGIEAIARLVGTVNFYLRDKNPYVWDIAKTTKEIKTNEV